MSVSVTCETLSLPNGQINYNDSQATNMAYPVNTRASFTCNFGYTLSGLSSSICQPSGNWDQETPICGESKLPINM